MEHAWYGAIESGGSTFVCLVGASPGEVLARTSFPTAEPAPTLSRAVDFFREATAAHGVLSAIGIASFGPLELRPAHPRFGFITATPKPGWTGTDIAGIIGGALGVPVGVDTDVNGGALGEGRWGAARGLDNFVYLTVGSGIGGAVVIDGQLAHGLGHTEMGHLTVPRADGDDYAGQCPFHGDCLEGMAGGFAMEGRWGRPPERLTGDVLRQAVSWEAAYLAAGLRNIVYTTAPARIVVGGKVCGLPGLLPLVRERLARLLGGYPGLAEQAADDFVVPSALGGMAGPAGGLVLAERAAARAPRSL